MTLRQITRGVVGAAALAVICLCVAAWVYRGLEGRIVGKEWPYIETGRIVANLLPAMLLWFWFFSSRHWRGRESGREVWAISRPALALVVVSSLSAIFGWMALGQPILERLFGYDHQGGAYTFGETFQAHLAGALLGLSVPVLVHGAFVAFRQKAQS
jgi:hypothetical protein